MQGSDRFFFLLLVRLHYVTALTFLERRNRPLRRFYTTMRIFSSTKARRESCVISLLVSLSLYLHSRYLPFRFFSYFHDHTFLHVSLLAFTPPFGNVFMAPSLASCLIILVAPLFLQCFLFPFVPFSTVSGSSSFVAWLRYLSYHFSCLGNNIPRSCIETGGCEHVNELQV